MLRPIVVSGPSGAGKSTLLKRLFQEFPDTTRSPRQGETDGVEYHFVTRQQFEQLIEKGAFIEYAQFSGNYYGTSFAAVEQVAQQNKVCILDIEIQGVRNVRKSHLDAAYCWISTPSMEELERRLRARGTESDDSLRARIDAARKDTDVIDNEPSLFDCYIVNDELDRAYQQFRQFVLAVNQEPAQVSNNNRLYQ